MITIMLVVTLVPLAVMAVINSHLYHNSLKQQNIDQLLGIVNKTKHSIQLYLQERLSTVQYIANGNTVEELRDANQLRNVFHTLSENISGFVDIGLINPDGQQVAYVGPYDLEGKDYSEHKSYHEVKVNGSYISDVFKGYRGFPHIVIAVKLTGPDHKSWVLRTTINIDNLNEILAAMKLDPRADAFLLNRAGTIQTPSKFYGDVLDSFPMEMPAKTFQPTINETRDNQGNNLIMAYAYFPKLEFVLTVIKPSNLFLQSWYSLKGQMLGIFIGGTLLIIIVIFRLTNTMVRRIKQADERREVALRELEHAQKLSSIGRMAAGIAHEVNNPLAVINEKAGLIKDIIQNNSNIPQSEKLTKLSDSILATVERAKDITYRLLGFASRLETRYEKLNINNVLRDVVSFLHREAAERNVNINMDFDENLTKVSTDRGQLEQVFLNILTNAVTAVDDGGKVDISTWEEDLGTVGVSIKDNGHGMDKETLRHIFEPFFTTKTGYGTGLGLSITYGIIKKLGGEIKADSEINSGTIFYIYLPKNNSQGDFR